MLPEDISYFFLQFAQQEIPRPPTFKALKVVECLDFTVSSLLQTCQLLWDKYHQCCSLIIIISTIAFLVPHLHLHVLTISAVLLKILQWLPLNSEQNLNANAGMISLLLPFQPHPVPPLAHQALYVLLAFSNLKYVYFISPVSHYACFLLVITGQLLLSFSISDKMSFSWKWDVRECIGSL